VADSVSATTQDFKETEIGLIPADWEVESIGGLFELKQGKAMSPESRRGIAPRPFLRTSNVLWGRLDLSTVDRMDFSDAEAEALALQPHDLLVCEGGEVGRTAVWRGEMEECAYQNHLHRLRRRRQDVWPEFYMYWMQAGFLLLRLYAGRETKTTIANLSGTRLRSLPVPHPPLSEQRRIAHVLSTIQRAIEAQAKVIAATKELKRSLMQRLFTHGPGPEPVPTKETEIGEIPEHWEVLPLRSLVDECYSGGTPSTKRPEFWGGDIPWTTSAYIEGLYLDSGAKRITSDGLANSASKLVPRGNLLVGTRVGVGKVAINSIDIAISQDLTGVLVDKSKTDAEFLAYAIRSAKVQEVVKSFSRGTTIKGIPREDLLRVPIPLPCLAEQREIARFLRTVDRKVVVEQSRSPALQELFKSMLHQLMTGQLRVKDIEV
jgi:type I restriction enzyme S subunit